MKAAIYARVSTDKQGRDQTIDSQLDALRRWVTTQGHELKDDHIYIDEGYSGARLDRPALDRLRDAAREGEFDVIGVYSPDRLARRYAYQIRHSSLIPTGDSSMNYLDLRLESGLDPFPKPFPQHG